MRGNNFVVSADFFHCFTHDFIILHTTPVIRKGADIVDDFVIRRQFLAFFAYRNRAVGDNLNAGGFADWPLAAPPDFPDNQGQGSGSHGADRRIAAMCRRKAAAFDGLLIKKARLSQMHMNINKTGKNKAAV